MFCMMVFFLYTLIAPTGKPEYPWLVLPEMYHEQVMKRADLNVGHMAVAKTLEHVQEHFW